MLDLIERCLKAAFQVSIGHHQDVLFIAGHQGDLLRHSGVQLKMAESGKSGEEIDFNWFGLREHHVGYLNYHYKVRLRF